MSSLVIAGAQWGDEGKGKITDFLSQKADFVVRYAGGDNAGHTLVHAGQKLHVQLIPSGICLPHVQNVIGTGVVVNPKTLFAEIDYLAAHGVAVHNLKVSSRAQVIMPYHQLFDQLQESLKSEKIGTTHKGIGPAYQDKLERIGIRIADLLDPETLRLRLEQALSVKNLLLTKVYEQEPLDFDSIYQEYLAYGEKLRPYVADTSYLINEALDAGQRVLFEGAQGIMLDIDHGTYPFVTSSNPVAGGAAVGAGVGPQRIQEIIGVAKVYCSRVGAGPFPTELHDETAQTIRDTAHEYGVVTGRPRRIGWLDIVALRHAKRVSGLTQLSLNCLDVLSGFETVKIATAYELDGQVIDYYPASERDLARCQPIYEELPGWSEDITTCKTLADLPAAARAYLNRVCELVDLPLATFAVGADRSATNVLGQLWRD
ncbi:adenylosuccinate synthase [Leuconostocaceae bacterium ESL0958]|nr:adenylosuccinate synthase [Leuconostocaceae bacterium ESL0958]